MNNIEIIAYTPRAGSKGYRTIVSTDCKLTDDQIDRYIKLSESRLIGFNYVSISKKVQQEHVSGSRRIGNEIIIAAYLTRKNKNIFSNIILKNKVLYLLESCYTNFVSDVIDATNWNEEAREKLIIESKFIYSLKLKSNNIVKKITSENVENNFIVSIISKYKKLFTFIIGFLSGSLLIISLGSYFNYSRYPQSLSNSSKLQSHDIQNKTKIYSENKVDTAYTENSSNSSHGDKLSLFSKLSILMLVTLSLYILILIYRKFTKKNSSGVDPKKTSNK